jgi:hypothetical protein
MSYIVNINNSNINLKKIIIPQGLIVLSFYANNYHTVIEVNESKTNEGITLYQISKIIKNVANKNNINKNIFKIIIDDMSGNTRCFSI